MSNTFAYVYSKADVNNGGFHVNAIVAEQAGGEEQEFQLDTGSSGMIIGQDRLKNVDLTKFPCFGPGSMHYYPSNNVRTGTWYYLPVTLKSADGSTAASNCMVLVVNDPADFQGGMMGVSAKGESPAYNVLLNASVNGQRLASGYILTPAHAEVGTVHQSGDGYNVVALNRVTPLIPAQTNSIPFTPPSIYSWDMPTVNATLISKDQSVAPSTLSVSFEMDTGIDTMLIKAPPAQIPASGFVADPQTASATAQQTVEDGAKIKVSVPGQNATPIIEYEFTIGGSSNPPETPSSAIYMGPASGQDGDVSRVNVGIHPLRAYDYLYDAEAGYIGFKQQ